jgi:primase-polymerase (primpol)-like protein
MNSRLMLIPVQHCVDGIPEFLKKLPQWVHWAATEKKDEGHFKSYGNYWIFQQKETDPLRMSSNEGVRS